MLLRRSHDISRLEAFSDAVFAFAGQQVVSAAVGVVVVLIAVATPRRYAFASPTAFILMWPAHWFYEVRTQRKGKAFETQLPPEPGAASGLP